MKITLLLAQYLYTHKRLDLPGIGTFLLDPSVAIEPEPDKNTKKDFGESITFENNPSIKENQALIDFIASHTGKIKALAAADLDSHLSLGLQFLNIGKPFMLEGIGSLVKMQAGQYAFTSGQLMPEVLKEQPSKQTHSAEIQEEAFSSYKDILRPRKEKLQWKKPVAFFLVVAGIALAIWGGYTIYKNSSAENEPVPTVEKKKTEEIVPATMIMDSTTTKDTLLPPKDNVAGPPPIAVPRGNYKFIVETAGRERAFKRFKLLKNLPTNIQLGTNDSITYQLFFMLPAAAADTARIMDSLRIHYTPKWSRAYITQ